MRIKIRPLLMAGGLALEQERQIEDAIKQLQAGKRVSTEEIDRILGEVSFERAR